MAKKLHPKYPIFIPSLGRADKCFSAEMFLKDDVPFSLVVQPDQVKAYADVYGIERLLVLPEDDKGLVYARLWIKDYSVAQGDERHWQFDDDVTQMNRIYKGNRIPCASNIAISLMEEFVDRYENVALASPNSNLLVICNGTTDAQHPPFYLNHRCYGVFLMMNSLPNRWRFRYNEDTDMTLQVLADGWCTILFNHFTMSTPETMTHGGGQTDFYLADGRLRMSRDLERVWPGVVTTKRRFGRPQHIVKDSWRRFDNKLIKKKGLKIKPGNDEHGMVLKAKRPIEDNSKQMQDLFKESRKTKRTTP
jgi:hypothetical protein